MLSHQLLGLGVETEAQLVFQPNSAQQPQRIVPEDRRRDRAQHAPFEVVHAAKWINELASAERLRDRVDGEVACGEIGFDVVLKRREVHRPTVVEGHAPRSVTLGERKDRPAVAPCRRLRIPAGDVDIDDGSGEQLVPHRSADDPSLLARERLAGPIKHLAPTASPVAGSNRSRRRSRS
jgi:hypothetical protein